MNIEKHELWSTPVWEIDTGFSQAFNQELLKEIEQLPRYTYYNIWSYDTPCIKTLKSKIFEVLDETVQSYFPTYYPYNPKIINGWVNSSKYNEEMALHDHGGAILACVYYVKAPEGCGELSLVDPRGGVNWEWKEADGSYNVKYQKFKPKEGKLILFPGYVMHSVSRNNSYEQRVSIATNIHNGDLTIIER